MREKRLNISTQATALNPAKPQNSHGQATIGELKATPMRAYSTVETQFLIVNDLMLHLLSLTVLKLPCHADFRSLAD